MLIFVIGFVCGAVATLLGGLLLLAMIDEIGPKNGRGVTSSKTSKVVT